MVSRQTDPMVSIKIETETIRLSQLLKFVNAAQDGSEAKFRIANEEVTVNGEVETRRGRKLYHGDQVGFEDKVYEIVAVPAT